MLEGSFTTHGLTEVIAVSSIGNQRPPPCHGATRSAPVIDEPWSTRTLRRATRCVLTRCWLLGDSRSQFGYAPVWRPPNMIIFRPSMLVCCLAACGGPSVVPPQVAPSAPSVAAEPPAAAPVAAARVASPPPANSPPARLVAESTALPGATPPVSLDLIFYEPNRSRVWVPAGGTGSVAVFDVAKHEFTRVEGFKTAEREARGKKRIMGPSSGAIGERFAYIGNRATQEVCAVELQTLKAGACLKLASAPDAVAYVSATHEVWVTTPNTQSVVVLEATPNGLLKQRAVIKLEGDPECYAVDEARGVFLTNLEDRGTTVRIDLKTHAVKGNWTAGCAADGPRGVAVDSARGLLLVACTDHVQALDLVHDGALLGRLETGPGVDNIDYVPSTGLLYVAAAKAARLTVARVGDHGELAAIATGETAAGARNAVADGAGNAYVADAQGARLLELHADSAH